MVRFWFPGAAVVFAVATACSPETGVIAEVVYKDGDALVVSELHFFVGAENEESGLFEPVPAMPYKASLDGGRNLADEPFAMLFPAEGGGDVTDSPTLKVYAIAFHDGEHVADGHIDKQVKFADKTVRKYELPLHRGIGLDGLDGGCVRDLSQPGDQWSISRPGDSDCDGYKASDCGPDGNAELCDCDDNDPNVNQTMGEACNTDSGTSDVCECLTDQSLGSNLCRSARESAHVRDVCGQGCWEDDLCFAESGGLCYAGTFEGECGSTRTGCDVSQATETALTYLCETPITSPEDTTAALEAQKLETITCTLGYVVTPTDNQLCKASIAVTSGPATNPCSWTLWKGDRYFLGFEQSDSSLERTVYEPDCMGTVRIDASFDPVPASDTVYIHEAIEPSVGPTTSTGLWEIRLEPSEVNSCPEVTGCTVITLE